MPFVESIPLAASFAELPAETCGYLLLYLVALVLHSVFMGYVLAGSACLAALVTLRKPGERGPFEPLLREWLPFMLSLGITAGIAPLLFIQILYRPAFYTANLLLFNRWMAVVPVLIVGFYLLYLLKNRWDESRSRVLTVAIPIVTAACFLLIAWSWTENHLLGLAGQEVWSRQFVSSSVIFHTSELLPRLGMWFCGTFPILAVWLSWQLWWPHRAGDSDGGDGISRAAMVGLAGLAGAFVCGGLYGMSMPDAHQDALASPAMRVPWAITVLGTLAVAILLLHQVQSQRLALSRLWLLSVSMLTALTGAAVLREAIRLNSLDMTRLATVHAEAAAVGGRWAFVAFLAVNSVLIMWCLKSVRST